jgi:hypothetical protein
MFTPSTAKHFLTEINQFNQANLYQDLQKLRQGFISFWAILNTHVI